MGEVNQAKSYKYLFFITLILLLGVLVGLYFFLNYKDSQSNTVSPDRANSPTQIPTDNKINPTLVPTTTSTKSTLTEKDANDNLYTNNRFGFSLTIPKFVTSSTCGEQKFPTMYFESKDIIYLAPESFYLPNPCQKNTTTLEQIENKNNYSLSKLKIYAAAVKNDTELEQFIKSKYGSGCSLGGKTQSPTADIYKVKILGDGKDLEESQCPINFMVDTKYNPTKGVVVIFELGQACNLSQNQDCADSKIVSSLKFL